MKAIEEEYKYISWEYVYTYLWKENTKYFNIQCFLQSI